MLTQEGYKPIESIQTDDLVLTHTNQFRRVLTPMSRPYKGVCFTLSSPIFHELTLTENHPLYVRQCLKHTGKRLIQDAPSWMSPKEIMQDLLSDPKTSYFVGYAINQESRLPQWCGVIDNRWGHGRICNTLSDKMPNPLFWYLMGRYIGDGWKKNSQTGRGIVICCGGRNEEKLIQVITDLGYNYTLSKERTCNKYIISSNELNAFVDRYGYYAHGKKIDFDTLCLPQHLLQSFMYGIIDSDGYYTSDGYYKITSVSKELIYGLGQCVAKAFHTPFSISRTARPKKVIIEGRECNQRDSWNISFKMDVRKQDKAFYQDGYIWAPIQKLLFSNKRIQVYNMSVETDESYTANGAIVHNCTSVSLAGKQAGLTEGSGTASSLLWECRRAIDIKRPKYCLMENVKALVSKKFMPQFLKWCDEMQSFGYTNFWKVLNAKDFGVPQNRECVFMLSVLSPDAQYEFPKGEPLTITLKDILEPQVEDKYILSAESIQGFKLYDNDSKPNE